MHCIDIKKLSGSQTSLPSQRILLYGPLVLPVLGSCNLTSVDQSEPNTNWPSAGKCQGTTNHREVQQGESIRGTAGSEGSNQFNHMCIALLTVHMVTKQLHIKLQLC